MESKGTYSCRDAQTKAAGFGGRIAKAGGEITRKKEEGKTETAGKGG